VLDPFSDHYLEVAAVDQDYTENLSLWKHRVITRYAQQELKRQVNQQALVRAFARLQQLITDEMRLTRKIRSRQGMARWWNAQVTTWINESTHAGSAEPEQTSLTNEPAPARAQPISSSLLTAMPSTPMTTTTSTTMSTSSVADLSAPLTGFQEDVLLLDHATHAHQTPFEPFPPLPPKARSPLNAHNPQRHTRRGSKDAKDAIKHTSASQRSTTRSTAPLPEHQPPHLPTEQEEPDIAVNVSVTADLPQHMRKRPSPHSSEWSSTDTASDTASDMTSTIDERKQAFGIEVRSTRWQ
jgi:hypothetical protein